MRDDPNKLNIRQAPGNDRLDRLTRSAGTRTLNPLYSRFIRSMRIVLPIIALSIAAVVFTWGNINEEKIKTLEEQIELPQSVGKNELLDPRFESTDDQQQPYTITAKRAIQGETNDDLIILEEPLGDILLESGNWIAIEAEQGAFRQDNQRLLLKGMVKIFHDQGYQLETEQLNVDVKESTAWSETDVYVQGPEGNIQAIGLQANQGAGHLVFNGPAKLTLTRIGDTFNPAGPQP